MIVKVDVGSRNVWLHEKVLRLYRESSGDEKSLREAAFAMNNSLETPLPEAEVVAIVEWMRNMGRVV